MITIPLALGIKSKVVHNVDGDTVCAIACTHILYTRRILIDNVSNRYTALSCGTQYIGQTDGRLNDRIREHRLSGSNHGDGICLLCGTTAVA